MESLGMTCRFIEDRLEQILAGTISSEMLAVIKGHLAKCDTCRQLVEIAEGRLDSRSGESAPDITREVLEKTSGVACEKARMQMGDWVDAQLRQGDRELLELHLKHCPPCQDLAAVLLSLKADLPSMAEVTPDPDFCPSVLKATVARKRWRTHVAKWWENLFRRPRIAWEAAYLGTLLIFGVLGVFPIPRVSKASFEISTLTSQPVAFLEFIGQSVSSKGVLESQFTIVLANSIDLRISMARRAVSTSVEVLKSATCHTWNVGSVAIYDGARWLHKKVTERSRTTCSLPLASPQASPSFRAEDLQILRSHRT